jgi:hypothetical protein
MFIYYKEVFMICNSADCFGFQAFEVVSLEGLFKVGGEETSSLPYFKLILKSRKSGFKKQLQIEAMAENIHQILELIQPASVDEISNLGRYPFRLPNSIKTLGRVHDLQGYKFSLPNSIVYIGEIYYLVDADNYYAPNEQPSYDHPLPKSLKAVGKVHSLKGYEYPLPKNVMFIGEVCFLEGYNFPLPPVETIGKIHNLKGYEFPLPDSLLYIGEAYLKGYKYKHLIPKNAKIVWCDDQTDYIFPKC